MDGFTAGLYGPQTMHESAEKITEEILRQAEGDTLIIMAHNGPKGLGSRRHDPCGKDFRPEEGAPCFDRIFGPIVEQKGSQPCFIEAARLASVSCVTIAALIKWQCKVQRSYLAGDYGDFDLRQAVDAATARGRAPALVTFGHMHQSLHKRYGAGNRNMVHIDQATGMLHLYTNTYLLCKLTVYHDELWSEVLL